MKHQELKRLLKYFEADKNEVIQVADKLESFFRPSQIKARMPERSFQNINSQLVAAVQAKYLYKHETEGLYSLDIPMIKAVEALLLQFQGVDVFLASEQVLNAIEDAGYVKVPEVCLELNYSYQHVKGIFNKSEKAGWLDNKGNQYCCSAKYFDFIKTLESI